MIYNNGIIVGIERIISKEWYMIINYIILYVCEKEEGRARGIVR